MDRNSNSYTFIYASVMVILVAAILSFTAISLKPFQKRNIEIEKKQNILASVQIESTVEDAEDLYEKTITKSYVVNDKGVVVEGDAFKVNLKVEHSKADKSQRLLPVFEANLGENGTKYIVPVRGAGLWGPIWGYISFDDDMNTIYGSFYDHEGETPGLGAEIATPHFQKQFISKTIFDDGKFVSIHVAKKGDNSVAPEHTVDAISGGTLTSTGLQTMLQDDLAEYLEFFKNVKKQN